MLIKVIQSNFGHSLFGTSLMNSDLRSLASSATSWAVSSARGPLPLSNNARTGRMPLITTCSAAPLSGADADRLINAMAPH